MHKKDETNKAVIKPNCTVFLQREGEEGPSESVGKPSLRMVQILQKVGDKNGSVGSNAVCVPGQKGWSCPSCTMAIQLISWATNSQGGQVELWQTKQWNGHRRGQGQRVL